MSRRTLLWLTVAAVTIGAAAAVGVVATRPGSSAAEPVSNAIVVSTRGCAVGWHAPASGHPTLPVRNATGATYDVALVGPNQQTVYGELEILAARTTRSVRIALPPGRYSWRCTSANGTVTYSSVESVRGAAVADAHPYVPVTYQELSAVTTTYRASVAAAMTVLAAETDTLRDAVAAGRLDDARRDWLVAHMEYERLGAAYGTFGDYDSQIDGRADGLAGGVRDPHFEGFHKLELDLWGTAASRPERVMVANRLDQSVHALVAAFPRLQTPPNDVALRTHEILENALQFELTGATDEGSHTNLATVRANVDGTELTLAAVAPLLRTRDPALLARATNGVHALASRLDTEDHAGVWTPVESLSRAERERLDAAVSGLLEQLSPIPDVLELPKDSDDS